MRLAPDRSFALGDRAVDARCSVQRRPEAVEAMARAGPYANVVLPTLDLLVAHGPEPVRAAARLSRAALSRPALEPMDVQ